MKKRPIALIILDGFGINQRNDGNAIYSANKPISEIDGRISNYQNSYKWYE